MAESVTADERRARGLAMFKEVYGDLVPAPTDADFFDLVIIDQQFAEVWTRRALDVPSRRLLIMGVLAAGGRFDTIQTQFHRALQTGELTVQQIREVVIHLVTYVGTPASGQLYAAGETAIALHAEESASPGTTEGSA
jgi:4-carboxymuconolactone decarboxylase